MQLILLSQKTGTSRCSRQQKLSYQHDVFSMDLADQANFMGVPVEITQEVKFKCVRLHSEGLIWVWNKLQFKLDKVQYFVCVSFSSYSNILESSSYSLIC